MAEKRRLPDVFSQFPSLDPAKPFAEEPVALDIFDISYVHFHKELELGLCVSGRGVCVVDGVEYPFSAGDVQVIFPFQAHLSKSEGAECSRWLWLYLDPALLLKGCGISDPLETERLLMQHMGLCGIFSERRYPDIYAACRALLHELDQPVQTPFHTETVGLRLYDLLLTVARCSVSLPKLALRRDAMITALAPALDRIRDGVLSGEVPSVTALAAACHLSVSRFRERFVAATGVAPRDYIAQCRIQRAKQLLLSTDQTVMSISGELGFESVSGFNRLFAAQTGLSPRRFRQRGIGEMLS